MIELRLYSSFTMLDIGLRKMLSKGFYPILMTESRNGNYTVIYEKRVIIRE